MSKVNATVAHLVLFVMGDNITDCELGVYPCECEKCLEIRRKEYKKEKILNIQKPTKK